LNKPAARPLSAFNYFPPMTLLLHLNNPPG
jgi:hypothetical protein